MGFKVHEIEEKHEKARLSERSSYDLTMEQVE